MKGERRGLSLPFQVEGKNRRDKPGGSPGCPPAQNLPSSFQFVFYALGTFVARIN